MSDRTWIPVQRWVASWPAGQLVAPPLEDVAIVDFDVHQSSGAITTTFTLAFAADLAFTLPGVDGLELLLLSDGEQTRLSADAVLGTTFVLNFHDLRASLRFSGELLRPVTRDDPSAPWEPKVENDGSPSSLVATFDVGLATVDADGRVVIEPAPTLSMDPFMIGETGIVLEASGITLILSGAQQPPVGQLVGFRGMSIDTATVYLPPSFAVDIAPPAHARRHRRLVRNPRRVRVRG